MRWQIMMAQLAQPVQTKEGMRDYQRTVQDLWRSTESEFQKEIQSDQDKNDFENVMGFSFVRGSNKDEPKDKGDLED